MVTNICITLWVLGYLGMLLGQLALGTRDSHLFINSLVVLLLGNRCFLFVKQHAIFLTVTIAFLSSTSQMEERPVLTDPAIRSIQMQEITLCFWKKVQSAILFPCQSIFLILRWENSASFHRPQPASHHSPGQLSPFLILKHVLNAQQKCWRCSSAKVKIILGLFCFPYHLYRKYLCVGEEKIVFDVWPQLYC